MIRYIVRHLGESRGRPRVYLDLPDLGAAGFDVGKTYSRQVDAEARRITLTAIPNGSHVVSGKDRDGRKLPVIDLHSSELLKPFEGMEAIRIVIEDQRIHLMPLASEARRLERLRRLRSNLAQGAVDTAGASYGGGVLDHAAHAGLAAAGIDARLVAANDIDESLLEHAREHNDTMRPETVVVAAPMQELVQDDWAMRRLPRSDIFTCGIPCSGASVAGRAKRSLTMMEAHPTVGHLIASAIMLIQRFNPAICVFENVPSYAGTASAQILRQHLRDSGYETDEVELNAADFGALEQRQRWFLLGASRGIEIDLANLAPPARPVRRVADILDDVPPDSPEWRTFQYLVDKQERDHAKGNHFSMQVITTESTQVPVLRAGYNKAGSTDPLLAHPTDPALRRLLTVREHARCKDVPPHLAEGLGRVHGHRMLGQSVAYAPVRELFKRIGLALRRWVETDSDGSATQHVPYSLRLATG